MNQSEKDKEDWIRETQMFQRIAKVPVSPVEELEADWYAMKPKHRKVAFKSLVTNNISAKEVIITAKQRSN